MDPRRHLRAVSFIVILVASVEDCQSTSTSCQIDFHMESEALMLLAEQNSSVLCDATCFAGQSGLDVFWRDTRGGRVSSYPSSVFAVSYNRGLMNRLLVIGASSQTAGTYVCSVMRNGELLQQRSLTLVVMGGDEVSGTQRPVDTGPRRGDLTPRRDLEYRPVRSANHDLFRPYVRSLLHHPGREGKKLEERITQIRKDQVWNNERAGRVGRVVSDADRTLVKWNLGQMNGIVQDRLTLAPARTDGEKTEDFERKKNMVPSEADNGLLNEKQQESESTLSESWKVDQNVDQVSITEKDDEPFDLDSSSYKADHHLHLARVKRDDPTPDNTTQTNSTTEVVSSTDDNTTQTTPTQSSAPENSTLEATSTAEITTTVEDTTSEDLHSGDGSTYEATLSPHFGPSEESTTKCPQEHTDQTTFGKFGVLAFSISLAIAFLLVYAIIMILCMPRMLAMKRSKMNVQGAQYKKNGTDADDTAVLTVLDGVDSPEGDLGQEKHDTVDLDKSLTSEGDKTDTEKKDEAKETTAAVSSFLIRQESQNKSEDPPKTDGNEKKEDPKQEADTKTNPPENVATPASGDALKKESDKEEVQPKSSDLASDLLSSILPELGLTGGQTSDGQKAVGGQSEPVSGSAAVPTSAASSEQAPSPVRESLADLLPPPPPPEISGNDPTAVTTV